MKPIALGDFTIRKFVESTGNISAPAEVFSSPTFRFLDPVE
jgi:hypothetical protein